MQSKKNLFILKVSKLILLAPLLFEYNYIDTPHH